MQDLRPLAALCGECGAAYAENVPLEKYTTFRIGGNCDAMAELPDAEAAQKIVRYLKETGIPFRLIGKGSNLLVRDEGYHGVVLRLTGSLEEVSPAENGRLRCGAGAPLKSLCLAALKASLTGLEFAYGIPGTVGGAVYMNAGAYDGDISQVLTEVTYLDEAGTLCTAQKDALELSYRHSIFMGRNCQILSAAFTLQQGEPEQIRSRMQDLLHRRQEKQPLEYPSAGSTFKRPEGSYASLLIDQCGLKGYRVGGAQVSTKHAGFVVNRGDATFADVMAVCRHVQETVQTQTGYRLDLEPEIL